MRFVIEAFRTPPSWRANWMGRVNLLIRPRIYSEESLPINEGMAIISRVTGFAFGPIEIALS